LVSKLLPGIIGLLSFEQEYGITGNQFKAVDGSGLNKSLVYFIASPANEG
jgi:hypothetical protein